MCAGASPVEAPHPRGLGSDQGLLDQQGTLVGLGVLLFGASGVFGELQASLNVVWEVAPKPGRGIRGFVEQRFF